MKIFEQALNGDTVLQEKFIDIINEFNPDIIVETGTYHGHTTEFLAQSKKPVYTTEILLENFNIAEKRLEGNENVTLLLGDSVTCLDLIFNEIKSKKIFAFLDSHGCNDSVLERELMLLKGLKHKPYIVIHDFYVPGERLNYDTWDGHRYDYEYFKQYIDGLYGENNYEYFYNQATPVSPIGVIFIKPKI